jgi:hypothetical protein
MPTTFLEWMQAVALLTGIASAIGIPSAILSGRRRRDAGMILVLRGVRKIGQLGYATALAVQGKKINGEMDDAIDGYAAFMAELDAHLEQKAFK